MILNLFEAKKRGFCSNHLEMTSFLSQTVSDIKMRPKTLQSRLNCLNYAENHMFISFSVQKKKANIALFRIKNPDSINIYMWDCTGGESRDFVSHFRCCFKHAA